jgi:hypothetical protein
MRPLRDFSGDMLLALLLLTCMAIYWNGLSGSFIYDDSTFLVENAALQVTDLQLSSWAAAATSFPSGVHQGRWIGMLSFAVNYYFTGLDTFWLKFTNLLIHLLNGLLVFLLVRSLLNLRKACWGTASNDTFNIGLVSAAIAGLWLVLPINLTAILYISQRLESLSNTFIFLGLWLYLRARLRNWEAGKGVLSMWASLAACTLAGVLVKESGVMLPLYAMLADFFLCGFRTRQGLWNRAVIVLYTVFLAIPFVIGCVWLGTWLDTHRTYARPFDTLQRLMTESRIFLDYIKWTVAPSLDDLTLFHDDIALSHGLLDPPTTIASLVAIVGTLAVAAWKRAKYPVAALGVFWFFAGHLLTGTVIPLLLAFEHRNYFSSLGLMIAGGALLTFEGGIRDSRIRIVVTSALIGFYGLTTFLRSEEWSDPVRLTMSEASKRPLSPGAQYELGRMLLVATQGADSHPLRQRGLDVLASGAKLPGAPILFEQLIIASNATAGEPTDPALWASMKQKLAQSPPSSPDIEALGKLLHCFKMRVCVDHVEEFAAVYASATSRPDASAVLRTQYAQLALDLLNDDALAERQVRAAIDQAPQDVASKGNLITLLVHQHRFSEARDVLEELQHLSYFGSLDKELARLSAMIGKSEAAQAEVREAPPSAH